MDVIFYTTADEPNVVDKSLIELATKQCTVHMEIEVEEPELLMQYDPAYALLNVNYCYIPDFGHYYFVEPFVYDGKLMRIKLHTDLLMTFKDALLNQTVTVDRNEYANQGYLQDDEYSALAYEQVQTKEFPNNFEGLNSYILMCVG